MSAFRLRRVEPETVDRQQRQAVDAETLAAAAAIVDDVRQRGEVGLRAHAERLGDLRPGEPLVRGQAELDAALAGLAPEQRALLERCAARLRTFARAQRDCLRELELELAGGHAGHSVAPVARAGCYAPGGRFALPSSVLMTALVARAAGVDQVWVASPRPSPMTLAAAAVARAHGVLAVGGAQAVAALAWGAGPVPACDAVVGPGNRWTTAAKQLVAGRVAIDMLAGPSELVVLADDSADAALVAADLLAQAEHDPDALPVLVSLDEVLVGEVEREIEAQLADLPTAEIARQSLARGFCVLVAGHEQAVRVCDRIAPEHLSLCLRGADKLAVRFRHYGALFVGAGSAEVLGDYGAGPNHVLPTGGTARFSSGLSVLTFLRVRTWLRIEDAAAAAPMARDAAALARLEGLEAHARSADRRAR